MSVSITDFGKLTTGQPVQLVTLKNDKIEVQLLTYAAIIHRIIVPDRKGNPVDVVLGYPTAADYELNTDSMGAAVGRFANRIAGAQFPLYEEIVHVTPNQNGNCLHSGLHGFNHTLFDVALTPGETDSVTMTAFSPAGTDGFPGNLEVEMVYRLEEEENALVIEYRATTDKATVVNLTNHGFFNLAGISNPTPTIENNIVTINANFYTPIDEVSIPTGEVAKVEGTPMDFTTPHTVGERINDKFQQLINGAGYDHCYVLNKIETGSLDLAATCFEPNSGRTMEVYTTEAGVQLYTGNWLNGFEGAHGATFPARSAICFEAQCFPDTPNKPHFPSATLLPGDEYQQVTIYKFGVKK